MEPNPLFSKVEQKCIRGGSLIAQQHEVMGGGIAPVLVQIRGGGLRGHRPREFETYKNFIRVYKQQMDIELNDDWIKKFKETDKLYQDFYKDDVYYINTRFVYINKSGDIERIKQESYLMNTKNYISREEMIGLLKRNLVDGSKKFSLLSILKYNITLDVEDVRGFLQSSRNNYEHFLTNVKHIEGIMFDKTIHMFQDLNELVFVFCEKIPSNNNTATKKVFFNQSNKKGTRRQYNSLL